MFKTPTAPTTAVLCLVAIASLASVPASAETVTLAFEAEIVTVFDTVPFDAGVSFDVGDKVTGRFTFEPDDVGGGSGPLKAFVSEQPTRAFINVNGVEFSTPDDATGITIRSFNNSGSTLYGETDRLRVGSTLIPTNPSGLLNITRGGFGLELQNHSDALPGAIIPASPTTWNGLIGFTRSLDLTLRNDLGGSIGFTAAVVPGSFVEIPEPATSSLMICLSVHFGVNRRRIGTLPKRRLETAQVTQHLSPRKVHRCEERSRE